MENAAKALLMAGGVLIGILILTLAAYLYASFGGTSQVIQDRMDSNELEQFNNRFISYQSKECTIYDVLTVVNMANEFNDKNELTLSDTNYYITVGGPGKINNNLTIDDVTSDWNSYSTTSAGEFKLNIYKVKTIKRSSLTGRVNYIEFE